MGFSRGEKLGSFIVTGPLGGGGMGDVYQARDPRLGREVAIKVLRENFADDPERLGRFKREARLLASLNHPNIAVLYELQEVEGVHLLVMELIEGPTLEKRLREGPLLLSEALDLFVQLADALESAHKRGVLHRDLKPSNLKITREGRLKVLDFGLAKAIHMDVMETHETGVAETQLGAILGTPAYMSPEQARGKEVDPRTDVWTFGCLLYEGLTGQRPFRGESLADTMAALLTAPPDWQSLPATVSVSLHRLLEGCLEKDVERRRADMGEICLELREEMRILDVLPPRPPGEGARRDEASFSAATLALSGAVERRCAACGAENPVGKRFCGDCGTLLVAESVQPADSSSAERRQLTVLYCGLDDSTSVSAQLDLEDLRDVMQAYQEACTRAIAHFGGFVAQTLGDAIMAYFGYPQAHEDDAQRAVRAALRIVQDLAELDLQSGGGEPMGLIVRVGIHTGMVVTGEANPPSPAPGLDVAAGPGVGRAPVFGETPNLATRVQAAGTPGAVVLGALTHELVLGQFACEELGTCEIGGGSQPMQLYRVLEEIPAGTRFEATMARGLTPLVGREEEVDLLLRRFERAKEGEGQAVLLSGEPGLGKSRLLQVLREHLRTEPHDELHYQCSPHYTHTAFHPMIEQLRRTAAVARDDGAATRFEKLRSLLARSPGLPDVALPLLADMLSIHLVAPAASESPEVPEGDAGDRVPSLHFSPQRQKERTIDVLVAQVLGMARRKPVLFLFEDAQWVDPTSLEVLTRVVEGLGEARILVVITGRPDFVPSWAGDAHITEHSLNRLSRRQCVALAEQTAGGKSMPDAVLQEIVAKTDGVPLFVEELTKMVVESGLVRLEEKGFVLAGPLPSLAIPATLKGSLMARLDRLASAKRVAQAGAAVGRRFSHDLLSAISPLSTSQLAEALDQLSACDLVFRRGQPPQATYTFKHALVQEAAYQSLLKKERQELHRRIAHHLEERFPETVRREPELLAHHRTAAGEGTKAVPYWLEAGRKGVERWALEEAVCHFREGLGVLQTLRESKERDALELDLQSNLYSTLMLAKGYAAPEVENVATRAEELCLRLGDASRLFQVLMGLSSFHQLRGQHGLAARSAARMLQIAEAAGDPDLLILAHVVLLSTHFFRGELVAAQHHSEVAMRLYDPERHRSLVYRFNHEPKVAAYILASQLSWILGFPDRAARMAQEKDQLARGLEHPYSLCFALGWGSVVHLYRRDLDTFEEHLKESHAIAREQGFPFLAAGIPIYLGWIDGERGDPHGGLARIREGLEAVAATGTYVTFYLILLADTLGKVGEIEEALATIDQAIERADEAGENYAAAEIYRIKGQILLRTEADDCEAQAEVAYRKALEIARGQEARGWELRVATSLAGLWRRQGRSDDARSLLAPIYGWFTEGLDTPDLQEARQRLQELG